MREKISKVALVSQGSGGSNNSSVYAAQRSRNAATDGCLSADCKRCLNVLPGGSR